MKVILVTNNPKVEKHFTPLYPTEFISGSLFDVIVIARNYVHLGHSLLTHPLSGSVKPNHTPYKSILLTALPSGVDMDSLRIIEGAIDTCTKLGLEKNTYPQTLEEDFMQVDFTLIEGALASYSQSQ
ncbi:MAG: GrdX protein [Clostridiales bacterium]|nr:GrdX protein [Clostridiales bacterium]